MKPGEALELRSDLEDYVGTVFASLPRRDQREKAAWYLLGAMIDGQRKSMQPMTERLDVDYQQIQQFVTTSPWPFAPVRRTLARRAVEAITPDVWVIDDTGFVKDGRSSPGVTRQYSGTLGKIGNCQIAVSIQAATDQASCALNWRLFIPGAWDDALADTNEGADLIALKREKARIPDTVRHVEKWRMGLEMVDELATWGVTPPAFAGDAGYGNATGFRRGLTQRGIPYILSVTHTTTAHPADAVPTRGQSTSGRGRPRTYTYPDPAKDLKQIALDAGRDAFTPVTWRATTHGQQPMQSQFLALRVRPANRDITPDERGVLPEEWLLVEWLESADEPTDYWLSTFPEDAQVAELVRLAKIRWRIEHDYRELKTGLGLAHYEGRSWLGWNHHVTLITAAHLFLTIRRLAHPKE
jgi:SRSO17 transposase